MKTNAPMKKMRKMKGRGGGGKNLSSFEHEIPVHKTYRIYTLLKRFSNCTRLLFIFFFFFRRPSSSSSSSSCIYGFWSIRRVAKGQRTTLGRDARCQRLHVTNEMHGHQVSVCAQIKVIYSFLMNSTRAAANSVSNYLSNRLKQIKRNYRCRLLAVSARVRFPCVCECVFGRRMCVARAHECRMCARGASSRPIYFYHINLVVVCVSRASDDPPPPRPLLACVLCERMSLSAL